MDEHFQKNLTELIHRELRGLPDQAAPVTLIPRVLSRIEQRKKQWWRRPWAEWPFHARLLSFPTLIGCVGAFLAGLSLAARWRVTDLAVSRISEFFRPMTPAWELSGRWGNALLLSVRSIEPHWLLLGAAVVFLMYLTCIALGTACFRVAAQKR
jgi:hypothetical protein